MRFYDREEEMALLQDIESQSRNSGLSLNDM
jgi:hypothetical protein